MTPPSESDEPIAADHETPPTGTEVPGTGRRWGGLLWASVIAVALMLGIGVGQVFLRARSAGHDATTARAPAGPARTVQPSPAGDAQAQARGLNALIASGKQAHERLRYNADTCDGLAAAVPAFERIVRDREQEWADADKLPVDQLPQAEKLRQALSETYQYSTEADRAYLADARAADDRAAPAKRRLVGL